MKRLVFSHFPVAPDVALLLLRVGSAVMLLTHGWSKITNYAERVNSFSDPIGLGPSLSLQLVIFAEVFCAVFLILGFMSRLFLIPLIINMAVIAFISHGDDAFNRQELPLLYLLVFFVLLLMGPGKISLDGQILKRRRY
ncbi:putative oxidoreductase [Cyclobacterium lianum]|uniref:Putative oxidoreductase n=1 Tax=Cyclobacterium lianum TaxID=388280 RepID=A0A1M7JUP7_9BACT|nr:DoxX family protein [Cyclobacterium lianum]SHM56267.1 putative oxidoreductase [Cyclobacterium lianum]